MIKQLRYLCTLLLIAVASAAWGEEESVTFSEQGYENGQAIETYTGTAFSISFDKGTNSNAPKYYTTGNAIRLYGSNSFTVSSDYTITSIELSFATGEGSNEITTDKGTYSNGTWAGSENSVTFTIGGTSGHRRLASVKVVYVTGGKPTPTVLIGEATLNIGETTEVTTNGPALTLETSDATVASVSGTTVKGVAAGTTTITAKWNENDDFAGGTKDFTVTVIDPNGPGSEGNPYTVAQARAAIDAGTGITGVYATGIVSTIPTAYSSQYGNITFNFIDSEGDTEFLQAYRCIGDEAADVAVGDIVVVYGNLTKYNTTYEFAQGCKLVSMTHPTVDVEQPVFSPEAGTYADAQTVAISCATNGATIYYTTDGTDPSDASTKYTDVISVTTTTTFKAIAIVGEKKSAVTTATYHINSQASPYTVAQVRVFNEYPTSGIYVHGIVSTAPTQAPTNNGELTYYISDDGTTTSQLEVYKGKGLEQAAFTAQDDIQVGDIVTIYGNLQVYNNTIEFGTGNYLVSFERPDAPYVLPVPTFSPEAGEVEAGTTVTINIPEDDNVDYVEYSYDQNAWIEYDEDFTFTINEETTIYARSVGTDGSYSEVASATYTIKAVTPAQDVVIVEDGKTTFLFNTEGNEWGFPVGSANKIVEETSYTANDVTIKVAGSEGNGFYYNTQGMLIVGKSGAYLTLPAFDFPVGKIEVTGKSGASSSVKQNIYVAENAVSTETTGAEGMNTYVIATDYQAAGNVYTLKVTSAHNTQITQIVVYKATGAEKADPQLKFSAATATATLGSEFAAPELTYVEGFDGTVKYESSNTDVATVDATSGEVTLIAAGEATIKATSEETDHYLAGEASYTLTVKESPVGEVVKYKLITSATDLTDGEYLIVSDLDNMAVAFDGSLETLDAVSNNVEVTITNKVIEASDAISFTIAAKEDGYSIKSHSGMFIGNTSDANALKTSANDEFVNAISFDEEGNADVVSANSYLRYNAANNQDRFRYFKSATYASQKAIQLFKKVTSTEILLGDMNDDNTVDVADVTALVNILLDEANRPTDEQIAAGDLSGDGGLSAEDVKLLVEKVLTEE